MWCAKLIGLLGAFSKTECFKFEYARSQSKNHFYTNDKMKLKKKLIYGYHP